MGNIWGEGVNNVQKSWGHFEGIYLYRVVLRIIYYGGQPGSLQGTKGEKKTRSKTAVLNSVIFSPLWYVVTNMPLRILI